NTARTLFDFAKTPSTWCRRMSTSSACATSRPFSPAWRISSEWITSFIRNGPRKAIDWPGSRRVAISAIPWPAPRISSTAFRFRIQEWWVTLRMGKQPRQDWPCGLVSVAPPYRGAEADLELLVWLRGPYRTLGIGRSCLQPIFEDLTNDLDASGALARAFQ